MMKCRFCRCTDRRACEGGCWWVAPEICSTCVEAYMLAALRANKRQLAATLRDARAKVEHHKPGSWAGKEALKEIAAVTYVMGLRNMEVPDGQA